MTRQELRRGSDRKKRIVQRILASRVQSEVLATKQQRSLFLEQYFANIPVEDLEGREEGKMAQAALDHLGFGAKRAKNKPLLRIFNPTEKEHGYVSTFTIIEMVNDDMPFLVDSISAAIGRLEMSVHITVHPIIAVLRDSRGNLKAIAKPGQDTGHSESYIRLAVDRETDPDRLDIIVQEITTVLADVRLAVRDWKKMLAKMLEARQSLQTAPRGVDTALHEENQTFLEWLVDEHFTFLGYREYKLSDRKNKLVLEPVAGSALGLLSRKKNGNRKIQLTPQMNRVKRARDWLILTKANSRSTVHRSAYLDYVGVKIYDANGEVCGERRFIGLFASTAYSEPPGNIPLLRYKIARIYDRARMKPVGHRGKALLHIINTYPRDELFNASIQDLARTTIGILNLQDRRRVKFFLRRDRFRRFFSCLVFVPKEKYTTAVRRRIEAILKEAFGGSSVESSVQIAESALARVHIVVRTPKGDRPRISIHRIEAQIADVVITWTDKLGEELRDKFGQDAANKLYNQYQDVFPLGYREDVRPSEACSDITRIEDMLANDKRRSVELYTPEDSESGHIHCMLYGFDEPLTLSAAMPLLEDMGVDVYTEHPYELKLQSGQSFWIQDFHLRHDLGATLDVASVASRFEDSFLQVLEGHAETDGLNRLILSARLDWRQTALLRCYAKHMQQLGIPFSQAYMEDVLVAHSKLARRLIEQFETQFDPTLRKSKREAALTSIKQAVERRVAKARNVDEDRILNAFAEAVGATLRTNYFQTNEDGSHKPYFSIKLDPSRLREAPLPRPKFEIFVYSPDVEGVHLRGGDIARGGIRWSDRREDFRTEVLGLMKAQVVKNTVIVPTGAKGGFFPKRPPTGNRDAILKSAIACYKTFVSGLLDITDNVIEGQVVTPDNVVRRDGEDPYLVVAADKGTATFSDMANSISESYNFWLDDAFASGGSAGYDHKKMGITARGAWEAVLRHFREFGVNIQEDPFTVVGIGDMSGDVFGNGMLLSKQIRLVAAFNHMHIFLDPDPDIAASFRERKRLFRKTRSGWADYDTSIISKGGGIHSRKDKTIRLSPEVRTLLGTSEKSMRPDQLIRTILGMHVDLLWNGGIGTYVKASNESHVDVGDRNNDNLRIDADKLNCKVVGEGGNLGLTQRARIEYSLNGGRINTDFIDNSGGVDSSDREVNIKILLSEVVKHRKMSRKRRNELLASMTDDVAKLVLRNNYLQTQAISMIEVESPERLDDITQLIGSLEKTGLLDRELEYLPEEDVIEERRARKQGFTRPELAVVLSYAKIDLYNGLIDSGQTLEDFLVVDPLRYFPTILRRRYAEFLPGHRLSRQILATLIANDLVNRMGPSFVKRIQADTGADIVTVARAYTIARQICRAGSLLKTIEDLDHKIPATVQMKMMFEISRTLRHASYWLIERFGEKLAIEATVERLKSGMTSVYARSASVMSSAARIRHENAARKLENMGVSDKLAQQMSTLLLTRPALDMADLAATYKPDVIEIATMYATFNDKLGLYWLHVAAEDLEVGDRWHAIARGKLRDEFFLMRRDLAIRILRMRGKRDLTSAADLWLSERTERVERFKDMLEEMKLRSEVDFATLSVAARELRNLIAT
ncbi:MAG: NAD-glutamate dehydrogenase [Gammaproteobacteria bacterium]|nr:NAD-glutamate dehydrogenase [Gammaproteobacteria bacterium]MDH3415313.1 NAD-glutamate dehydrogenase [Gammaproteobacteria bacterium]